MMHIRSVFFRGFVVSIRQWRISAVVYFFQLCLVLTLGMQVYEVLTASIGKSLEINKLLFGYDHTVMTDFLKVHGASITPLLGQLRWLLLVWMLFSVFIDAGLLVAAASPEATGGRTFWEGGARYFFRFLKIRLIMLVLVILWTLVLLLPVALLFQPSVEYFSSEKPMVWLTLGALAVYFVGLVMLFLWSVVSRLVNMKTDASIAKSIRQGGRIFWQHKGRLLVIFTGFGIVQVLLIMLYWTLEGLTGMTSPLLMLVFFGMQQAFVFGRILIRQMVYVGVSSVV